jgi:hypothetical protein
MQRIPPTQPPPDLALLLLTITTETMRVIIRDLIVPIVALGITLATLRQPVPRVPAAPAATVQLEALPVRELRQLARAAGHRGLARKGRRQQLLEVLA